MTTVLRIMGRVFCLLLSSTLLVLIAVNVRNAWPETENASRMLQGMATLWLMMLWFPSTRWKE